MAEYISREAAINARNRSCKKNCAECDFAIEGDSWCEGEVFVVDLLRIPAADVRPVVRGKWLPIIEANEYGESYQAGCYCSECNEVLQYETNFCPNCGADMREES